MTQHCLTPKQIEVLRYLSQGLQNKQIAKAMGLSTATVKIHLNGIYMRLNVSNRIQAVLRAQSSDLI